MELAKTKMSYAHLSDKNKAVEFDSAVRFPEKLLDALSADSPLLYWAPGGESVIVNDVLFEKHVMTSFPGLVQIPTYANLRRQMKAYGFDWKVNDNDEYEFWHPYFIRDKPELIDKVVTRRKSFRLPASRSKDKMSIPEGRKLYRRTVMALRQRNESGIPVCDDNILTRSKKRKLDFDSSTENSDQNLTDCNNNDVSFKQIEGPEAECDDGIGMFTGLTSNAKPNQHLKENDNKIFQNGSCEGRYGTFGVTSLPKLRGTCCLLCGHAPTLRQSPKFNLHYWNEFEEPPTKTIGTQTDIDFQVCDDALPSFQLAFGPHRIPVCWPPFFSENIDVPENIHCYTGYNTVTSHGNVSYTQL